MTTHATDMRHDSPARSGAMVVIVMICLVLATAMTASAVKMVLLNTSVVNREVERRQLSLAVEAAARRASILLQQDPAFEGDTWTVTVSTSSATTPEADPVTSAVPTVAITSAPVAGDSSAQWELYGRFLNRRPTEQIELRRTFLID